jgi:hypothetical protein
LAYVQKVLEIQEKSVIDIRGEMSLVNEGMARSSQEIIESIKKEADSNAYKFEQINIRLTLAEIQQNSLLAKVGTQQSRSETLEKYFDKQKLHFENIQKDLLILGSTKVNKDDYGRTMKDLNERL